PHCPAPRSTLLPYPTLFRSLTELIHRGGCLLTRRTRDGSKVRNTLNSLHRGIQLNTSRCERTDVAGHLGEVVDGHVGVAIQLIKDRKSTRLNSSHVSISYAV